MIGHVRIASRDRTIELREQSSMATRLAPAHHAHLCAREDAGCGQQVTGFCDRDPAIHCAQRGSNVVAYSRLPRSGCVLLGPFDEPFRIREALVDARPHRFSV